MIGTIVICILDRPKWHDMSRRVYSPNGLCPSVHTQSGGSTKIKVLVDEVDAD